MTDYSDKTVCVVDTGVFPEIARSLSKAFGKVFYTSPWVADYVSSYKTELGEGFPNYERINDIWEVVDDIDLFVFTDLHQGPLQEYLVEKGKRVFGSRNADELECDRVAAKAHFTEIGIPQSPYVVVTGMDALRKYVKSRGSDKLWVKIDRNRGDTETFCVEGYDLAKNRLDALEAKFGPVADYRDFVVEEHVPDTYDLAIDTYCIDGQYPQTAMLGIEEKDMGYACVVKPWGKMPPALIDIYDRLTPTLEEYQYRSLFATECRTGKDNITMSDPCCRFGSPVSELELNMIANLPEVMWEGADGNMVEPVYRAKYGCEVLIKSTWVYKNPLLIEYPEEYRDQIKFRYATQFGDETWILPQALADEVGANSEVTVGAIVAYGASLDACMAEVEEIGSQIKGTDIEITTGSMDALNANLEEMASWGITF